MLLRLVYSEELFITGYAVVLAIFLLHFWADPPPLRFSSTGKWPILSELGIVATILHCSVTRKMSPVALPLNMV